MIGALVAGFPALVVDRLLDLHLERYLPQMTAEERAEMAAFREQVRQSADHYRSVRTAGSGSAATAMRPGGAQSAPNELGVSEVMAVLRLQSRQVRNLAQRWEVDGLARKVGRAWLIDRAAVELHESRTGRSA